MAIRKTGPPSIKPISAGPSLSKLLVSECHPKGNSFATKIPSVCSTAATVSLSSRQAPLPVAKLEHLMTGGRGSRIPRWRSHAPPSTEVQVQTSSQACRKETLWSRSSKKASGQRKPVSGGPAAKVPKSVVEVPPISQLRGVTNPCLEEGIPLTVCPTAMPLATFPVCTRRSRQFWPAESAEPLVQPSTHDTLVPRDANRPSHMGCRLRRSSGRPRRQRAFLTSTTRASISSPLSPFETSGTEVIAHTHSEPK
ncbi:hypothetical protein M405DRAFT_834418 [Rhizopogon salebrosus TDB-379]|nr:hypothetical protein M405DRAFT_834418 [Rhizopogon salebrosus TDB-379]